MLVLVVVCLRPYQPFFLEQAVGRLFGSLGNVRRDLGDSGAKPTHLGLAQVQGRGSSTLAANPFAEVIYVFHAPFLHFVQVIASGTLHMVQSPCGRGWAVKAKLRVRLTGLTL